MTGAIETRYAGILFRSRIEARWALFFDTLGVPYEYEKEGFDLDGLRYLPDFWLPDQRIWYEIKGDIPDELECEKARRLSGYTQRPVYIAFGAVAIPDFTRLVNTDDQRVWKGPNWVFHQHGGPFPIRWWYECPVCGYCDLATTGSGGGPQQPCGHADSDAWEDRHETPRLVRAYTAARSARFEFGATGK